MENQIGYACVIARKFSNDLSVSFQCNFEVGAQPATISAELDKLATILERQQIQIDIPTLERQIEQQKLNLDKEASSIQELSLKIAEGPNREMRVSNLEQMKTQHNNAITTYAAMKENIKRAETHLEGLKKAV